MAERTTLRSRSTLQRNETLDVAQRLAVTATRLGVFHQNDGSGIARGSVTVEVWCRSRENPEWVFLGSVTRTAADGWEDKVTSEGTIVNPRLWIGVEHPLLHDAQVQLRLVSSANIDGDVSLETGDFEDVL